MGSAGPPGEVIGMVGAPASAGLITGALTAPAAP
jgi:hypothetical protein